MWRGVERCVATGEVQAIWQRMHARAPHRCLDGFFRGIMRSVLQLRTSEGRNSVEPQHASLSADVHGSVASPRIRFRDSQIEMAHGAGGKASRRLIEGLFAPILCGADAALTDAAHLNLNGARVAITTDSFVVKPLRFSGGSIGDLAVNGTLNDLAVSGARGMALVTSFVLEAGLRTEILQAEIEAMSAAARNAGVQIVGGDTKVVEHGKADSMYISTTGIGVPIAGVDI